MVDAHDEAGDRRTGEARGRHLAAERIREPGLAVGLDVAALRPLRELLDERVEARVVERDRSGSATALLDRGAVLEDDLPFGRRLGGGGQGSSSRLDGRRRAGVGSAI
jgi:hypothetical protein